MERLKAIKENLIGCVQSQMGDMRNVDAQELGEVVDMIKDLEEAIYYCTITKAMNEKEKEEKPHTNNYYYTERYIPEYDRDMDRRYGKMYYTDNGNGANDGHTSGQSYYNSRLPNDMRDWREGRSGIQRRYYMESKEMHQDSAMQMHELEKYMQELSKDVTELIEKASPEEKKILKQKMSALTDKINV